MGIGGTIGRARECGREFPFSKLKYKKIMHFPILSSFPVIAISYLWVPLSPVSLLLNSYCPCYCPAPCVQKGAL